MPNCPSSIAVKQAGDAKKSAALAEGSAANAVLDLKQVETRVASLKWPTRSDVGTGKEAGYAFPCTTRESRKSSKPLSRPLDDKLFQIRTASAFRGVSLATMEVAQFVSTLNPVLEGDDLESPGWHMFGAPVRDTIGCGFGTRECSLTSKQLRERRRRQQHCCERSLLSGSMFQKSRDTGVNFKLWSFWPANVVLVDIKEHP